MKSLFKLFFIAVVFMVGITADAQVRGPYLDTLKGVTAFKRVISNSGNYQSVSIHTRAHQLAGTSEGTVYLEASNVNVDSMYVTLNGDFGDNASFSVNDTLTVADNAEWIIQLNHPSFRYYRLNSTGGSGDTTKFTTYYYFKDN